VIPGQTNEAEIIRDFGEPTNVDMRFDYFNVLRNEGAATKYGFVYYGASTNNLVAGGPLGEAREVHVYFTPDRKVLSVEWRYEEGYRYHTRTHEDRTAITKEQIEALAGRSPITFRKIQGNPPDAKIYEFDVNKIHVEVWYLGPGSEVLVVVT
jgi:hypothetical protein